MMGMASSAPERVGEVAASAEFQDVVESASQGDDVSAFRDVVVHVSAFRDVVVSASLELSGFLARQK